jgi:NDP-sugar pyrophosphorylase family protein
LPDLVLILSGDHIYTMDYNPMLRFHRERDADVTLAVYSVPGFEAYRFGMTSFFGAANASAVAAAIVVHALSFGPVILAGLLFMAQDGLTIGRLRSLADSEGARGAALNS